MLKKVHVYHMNLLMDTIDELIKKGAKIVAVVPDTYTTVTSNITKTTQAVVIYEVQENGESSNTPT